MDSSSTKIIATPDNPRFVMDGVVDILPLAIATVPWGILCGSLSIDIGLSGLEALLMSALVFAGAAQLGGLALMGQGVPGLSILGSTFVISSRHLLYSATFRDDVKDLPFNKKIALAFLLTDEMFAVTENYTRRIGYFCVPYALASGLTFYILWNISTLTGIFLGQKMPNLQSIGLEFAIAATFIAIVIPSLNRYPMVLGTVVSFTLSAYLNWIQMPHALVISTLVGMTVGFIIKTGKVK